MILKTHADERPRRQPEYMTYHEQVRALEVNRYYRDALQMIAAPVAPPEDLENFNREMCRVLMARLQIAMRALKGEKLIPEELAPTSNTGETGK